MNLASIHKLLKKSSKAVKEEKEEFFDSFNSLLIVDQKMPYDVWRDAPSDANSLTIDSYDGITVSDGETIIKPKTEITREDYYHKLWTKGGIQICTNSVSTELNDKNLKITFDGTQQKTIEFSAYDLCIEADYYRNGTPVEPDPKYKDKNIPWTWGGKGSGYGPVLMVINEGIEKEETFTKKGYRAKFNVKIKGPDGLPPDHAIILQTDDASSRRIAVYEKGSEYGTEPLIGKCKCYSDPIFKPGDTNKIISCFAFALQYPDRNFDGLITLGLNLAIADPDEEDKWIPVYYEATGESYHCPYLISTQFRVSPWMMTPNTQPPEEFYVAEVPYSYFDEDGYHNNDGFINQIKDAYRHLFQKDMTLIEPKYDRNDPWMQDELEFGYSQKHTGTRGTFNVLLHSPRDRGLALYPELGDILNQNIGCITRNGSGIKCSLDSFGNLEVTPPTKDYPLGRIIYGGCLPGSNKRRMMGVVRDFLEAQQVQKPLELFTDWLKVGHVDEMLTFVPSDKGEHKFKLLLASPNTFYDELKKEVRQRPDKMLFGGKKDINGKSMEITVSQLLLDGDLKKKNDIYQNHINKNRKWLVDGLQIKDPDDIIEIPALFEYDRKEPDPEKQQAFAYMPGMVNMVVLDKNLLIPNPFSDFIQKYVTDILNPLGFTCIFIDDWSSYHIQDGEVHCGTNVRRTPLSTPWWEYTEKKQVTIPKETTEPTRVLVGQF